MNDLIISLLQRITSITPTDWQYTPVMLLIITISAIVLYWFCLKVIAVIVRIITRRTENEWDDDLLNDKVLSAACQLAPALLVAHMLPQSFNQDSAIQEWLSKATDFYILWAFIHLINTFLQSLFDAFDKRGHHLIHTLRGVLQMIKLFFIIIGIIIGFSILFGKSPLTILTALGASAAVLMLVFQDTLLGLVAGIQLTVNDMLKKGDWIIVPKANANGIVTEISLTAIKVLNWDNSVTTVPPYTLIKDSFQNYATMIQTEARRICRYVYIDVNSVRFLTSDELDRLMTLGLINAADIHDSETPVNLHLFRLHLERYLSNHTNVRSDLMYMVRQLQPTPQGIPLELYFFTSITDWKPYEHLQAEIFDHVYACSREFNLMLYQAPAGTDFKQGFTKFNATP